MKTMDKIPKDLKRWLKDNSRYTEFLRLIYDIKKWLNTPSNEKYIVTKDKNVVEYSLFLDKLKLNWK